MPCPEHIATQALFDGELDANTALAAERHVETCGPCTSALDELRALRKALGGASYHRAPTSLRQQIAARLGPLDRPRPRFGFTGDLRKYLWGAAGGAGATALAAALSFVLLLSPASGVVVDDVVNAHLRSLIAGHLIDVASSDRHTVKPWFEGHADVSPPADDFAASGYRLIGGRADYIDGHRAAAVVYRHGAHVINVFVWAKGADTAVPPSTVRDGYRIRFWTSGDLVYCAVSDTGDAELARLEELIKAAGS